MERNFGLIIRELYYLRIITYNAGSRSENYWIIKRFIKVSFCFLRPGMGSMVPEVISRIF